MRFAAPLLLGAALILGGCGDAAPTQAPPITGKVKDWKTMTKDEKLKFIEENRMMPPPEKEKMRQRVMQGLE